MPQALERACLHRQADVQPAKSQVDEETDSWRSSAQEEKWGWEQLEMWKEEKERRKPGCEELASTHEQKHVKITNESLALLVVVVAAAADKRMFGWREYLYVIWPSDQERKLKLLVQTTELLELE